MNKFKDNVVYISGPITGQKDYEKKFNEVENFLKPICLDVINPINLGKKFMKDYGLSSNDVSWSNFMRVDLYELLSAHIMVMLPGWSYSKGAKLEHEIAKALDFKIYYIDINFFC